jgi:hypothetical protein
MLGFSLLDLTISPNYKMRLDRFVELVNITSTNLDDHDIVFPQLCEIYAS